MPTIIPKGYYCPKCKKQLKKKVCDCGTVAKPQPPYTVRFRWINEDGIEEHKRLTGTPPWTTQSAAQMGYAEWIAQHPSHEKKGVISLEFLPLYNEYKENLKTTVKESSYMSMTQRMDKYVVPYFKDKKVNEITAADITQWQRKLNSLEHTLSTIYKTNIRTSFYHFFSYLNIYGIANPLALVKGFHRNKEQRRKMQIWTEDEFKQFIAVVNDLRFRAVFMFLYLTGCRKGEALALTWDKINLNAKTAEIESTITKATDTSRKKSEGEKLSTLYRKTTPKTVNSYRTILLPDPLVECLRELKANAAPSDFVFGNGSSIMPFNTLEHVFKKYITQSGVKPIRIHDLRHSHASLLINKGENSLSTIYVIAARLGDTVSMVFETYGHLFPNTQRELLDKLNHIF